MTGLSLLNNLINGISLGSVYAIIALGYTMVYGIAKMLNFAHGDVIMVGAYVCFFASSSFGLPPILGVLLAMAVCTALGVVIERLAYKPLRQATSLAVLITAIGMSYFLQNAAQLLWTSNPKIFPTFFTVTDRETGAVKTGISLFEGQLNLSYASIVTIAACIVIMIALTLFTSKSKMGKAMRVVSEDKGAAELMGINVNLTITVTFAIGVTAITIIVSFLAALALDKRGRDRLPRGLMRALWFFPALLSGAVVGILWRIMYNYNNGVINKIITSAGLPAVNWLETRGVTNIAIIIGAAWVQIGLCVVVFLAGLQSIPQEMYEAASIDGATPSQQLKNITIPMMASSITINVITTTIAAFKAYELPYLISKGLPGHSTLLITQRIFFFGFQAFDYGRGSALSVVLLLIIALISLVQLVVLRKREDIF